MARREKNTDVVIVGLGWTGAILGIELANAGLKVLALERGEDRDTVPHLAYPKMIDELKLWRSPRPNAATCRLDGDYPPFGT